MAASNYQIGGGLNFGSAPGFDYNSAYQAALSLNQQNYSNILAGYQQLAASQYADQQPIQAGYDALTGKVLSDIAGVGTSAMQDIQDQYAKQSGSASQSMISRGLANNTVRDSVQRGLTLDKAKAQNNLSNQMAQLTAGYRSNLGSQALGYQNQALQQRMALGQSQLGFQNSVSAPYPNAGDYMRLAQMRGAMSAGLPRQGGLGAGGVGQSRVPSGMSSQGSALFNSKGFAPTMGYMQGGVGGYQAPGGLRPGSGQGQESLGEINPLADSMQPGYGQGEGVAGGFNLGNGPSSAGNPSAYNTPMEQYAGAGDYMYDPYNSQTPADAQYWGAQDEQDYQDSQQPQYSEDPNAYMFGSTNFDPNLDWSFGE